MPNGFGEPEFKACAGVQFENVDVNVGNADNLDEALEEAVRELDEVSARFESLPLVAAVNFVGESHADEQLRNAGDDLTEHLRRRWSGNHSLHVVSGAKVMTRPVWDRSEILAEQSFRSAVLKRLDGMRKQIEDETGVDKISPTAKTALIAPLEEFDSKAAAHLGEQLRERPEILSEVIDDAERILITLLMDDS
jgi:hypothetical protein